MNSKGVVCRLDERGGIVLPGHILEASKIKVEGSVEINVEEDSIVIVKGDDLCAICDSGHGLLQFKSRKICSDCIEDVSTYVDLHAFVNNKGHK